MISRRRVNIFPKALGWCVLHASPQNTVGEADVLISVFDVIYFCMKHLLSFTLKVLKTLLGMWVTVMLSNKIFQWVMNVFKEKSIQQWKPKQKWNTTKTFENIFTMIMANIKKKCQLVSK